MALGHPHRGGVSVVGGGVLGISVGILLQALGTKVRLFTARRADREVASPTDPRFASAFPAASVIPHSVTLDNAAEVIQASATMFAALHRHLPAWVRRQWHYELFEGEPTSPPAYLDMLEDVALLGTGHAGPSPLRRSPDVPVSGWRFRMFFVETPQYLAVLFRLFEHLGGTVELRTLHRDELGTLPGDALVLCAGMDTPQLLGSREQKTFEAGCLVHLPIGLRDLPVEPASYNYTPEASLHPGTGGTAMDVYAYPRQRSLVLGGTRLPGIEDAAGAHHVEPYRGPTVPVESHGGRTLQVPRPIFELNRPLLRQLLGLDISGQPLRAVVGWRYRGPTASAGPSFEATTLDDRPLLACYALGGAGVTLSWGLAAKIALRLSGRAEPPQALATPKLCQEIARLAGRVAG